ncbi:hypothetical protein F4810DRAFT_694717 [Camillea tinctor]|nr:hypothetical protein F4810DRAFT_694717 [Camillea tinctor]
MVSSGATAGIAIACAIAGAAIASTIFLLLRRRRPNPAASTSSIISRLEGIRADTLKYLPEDLPHSQSRLEFGFMDLAIKDLVSKFFHDQPVPPGTVDAGKIDALVGNSSINWTPNLCDPSNRKHALRGYIARTLFHRTDLSTSAVETNLLPVDIVRCYRPALAGDHHRGTFLLSPSLFFFFFKAAHQLTPPGTPHILGLWRALTAHLLSKPYPTQAFPYAELAAADRRIENIRLLAAELADALHPFRNDKSEERFVYALKRAVQQYAQLAWRLFAQRNPVEVAWPGAAAERMVVYPALRQRDLDTGVVGTVSEARYEEVKACYGGWGELGG